MRQVLKEKGFYVGREGKSVCCRTSKPDFLCSECRVGYNHSNPDNPISLKPTLSTSRASNIPAPRLPRHPNQTGIPSGTYRAIDGSIRCSDCHNVHSTPVTSTSTSTLSVSCPPKGAQPMRNAAAVKTTLSDQELRDLLQSSLKESEPNASILSVYSGTSEILYVLNGNHYKRTFTIKDDISITWGDPVQVVEEKTYVPVTNSVSARLAASSSHNTPRPLPDTWGLSNSEGSVSVSTPNRKESVSTPNRKESLIASLSTSQTAFTVDDLNGMSIPELEKLERVAVEAQRKSARDYSGQIGSIPFSVGEKMKRPLPDTWGLRAAADKKKGETS